MKKLLSPLAGLIFAVVAMFAVPASATNCPSNPFTLTNGQAADASQVMANFNSLLNCLNLNMLPNVNPSWTGTATGQNLNLSGTATLSGGVIGNLAVTGSPTFGTNTSAAQEILNGPAGSVRDVLFETAGVGRWLVGSTSGAEGGSNSGSDFVVQALSDGGVVLSNPILINRATGLVSISGAGLAINGATPLTFSTGTITANTGSCTGVSAVTGNTLAGSFALTASCPVNGFVTMVFPVSAPHGWVCILQDSTVQSARFTQNAFTTNSCSLPVSNVATGSTDGVLYSATPF